MENLNTRELVKRELADKQFDEKSIELICGAIDEFDDLFGKYVNKAELIRRLKECLKEIKFEPKLYDDVLGLFNEDKKEILILETLSEEKMKNVFFHEFIHCITYDPQRKKCGFSETYEISDSDDIAIMGIGITEGFTQFVTRIRNEKYSNKQISNAYPILSEQVGNLVELIGEDRFLDIGFNNPEKLPKEMGNIPEFQYYDFLEDFDVIWKEEKHIYETTKKPLTKEEKNFMDILGIKVWNKDTKRLKNAKQGLIYFFQKIMLKKPIRTIDEFNNIYDKISQYGEQIGITLNSQILRGLQSKIDELQNTGLSIEEILEGVNEEYAVFYRANEFVSRFRNFTGKEIMESISSDAEIKAWCEEFIYFEKYCDDFGKDLIIELTNGLIQTNSSQESLALFEILVNGLFQHIKDNGFNVDRLAVECIDFSQKDYGFDIRKIFNVDLTRKIFNFYDTDFDKRTYLGTFGLNFDRTEISEFRPINVKEDIEQIRQKYPQLKDAIISLSENGEIIAYMGGGQYILIDEDGKELFSKEETSYSPSQLERNQDKILARFEILKNFKENMNVSCIIENEEKLLREIVKRNIGNIRI